MINVLLSSEILKQTNVSLQRNKKQEYIRCWRKWNDKYKTCPLFWCLHHINVDYCETDSVRLSEFIAVSAGRNYCFLLERSFDLSLYCFFFLLNEMTRISPASFKKITAVFNFDLWTITSSKWYIKLVQKDDCTFRV